MSNLKGLNAYITGGSRGIGRAVANKFAEEGVNVAIISRNLKESTEVAENLSKTYGVKTWAMQADISNPDHVNRLEKELAEKVKNLHIAFNNAGVCKHQGAFETSFEDWNYVININLTGTYLTSKMAAKLMIDKKIKGSIINMASMSAQIVNIPQKQCAYNASKAGVIHLTKSLAVEWVEYGIRVNSISPGYISTDMSTNTPQELKDSWAKQGIMPRMGTPEELYEAIRYLASPQATFTTGTDVLVDGGFTCV